MASRHPILDQLVELALIEERRVFGLLQKEEEFGVILPELDPMMNRYAKLLVAIQGMRFDLGLDAYCRTMSPAERTFRQAEARQEEERAIYEAYAEAEKVFAKLRQQRNAEDTFQ